MKIIKISVLILALLALIYLSKPKAASGQPITTIGISEGLQISALVASTPTERWQGLKGVESMPSEYHGMLFVFEYESSRNFTMEGTLMSLDIVFLDKNKVITVIFDNVEHYPEFVLGKKPVTVGATAKYVLELPAGKAKEYGLNKGMQLNFKIEGDDGYHTPKVPYVSGPITSFLKKLIMEGKQRPPPPPDLDPIGQIFITPAKSQQMPKTPPTVPS